MPLVFNAAYLLIHNHFSPTYFMDIAILDQPEFWKPNVQLILWSIFYPCSSTGIFTVQLYKNKSMFTALFWLLKQKKANSKTSKKPINKA